jgi:hypothetical protein
MKTGVAVYFIKFGGIDGLGISSVAEDGDTDQRVFYIPSIRTPALMLNWT